MSIVDSNGNKIIAAGNHSDMIFPTDGHGKKARVKGSFSKRVLSMERTIAYEEHMAEDRGEKFDPATVTKPLTLFRVHTAGAVVFLK